MTTNDQAPGGMLSDAEKEEIYRKARRRAKARFGFYIHAGAFTAAMVLLAAVNLLASPGTLWVIWPFIGWGLGLGLHWLFGIRLVGVYGSLEEREIARELEQTARGRVDDDPTG